MDAQGAGWIPTTENRGHSQVRGQTASSWVSERALLRHLCSQIGADSSRVCIDKDAYPDHCTNLEMREKKEIVKYLCLEIHVGELSGIVVRF